MIVVSCGTAQLAALEATLSEQIGRDARPGRQEKRHQLQRQSYYTASFFPGREPGAGRGRIDGPLSTHQERINDAGATVASDPCTPSNDEPHLHDCLDLTATQLHKKYKHEYESWKNHKTRTKERGLDVHPQFEKFSDFLASVGPCNGGTLDRKNPSDPEYAPARSAGRTSGRSRSTGETCA